jgi:polyisoprenoid-binding protein YceI
VAAGLLLIAGLALALAALIAIERLQPDAPTPSTSCQAPAPDHRIYRLDTAQTTLRYDLDIQRLNPSQLDRLTGELNNLSGFVVVNPAAPQASRLCDLRLEFATLPSSASLGGLEPTVLLNLADYPDAQFGFGEWVGWPDALPQERPVELEVRGLLTVKGITQPSIWRVRLTIEPDQVTGQADSVLLLSDYELGPLKVEGVLESADDVALTLQFIARAEK